MPGTRAAVLRFRPRATDAVRRLHADGLLPLPRRLARPGLVGETRGPVPGGSSIHLARAGVREDGGQGAQTGVRSGQRSVGAVCGWPYADSSRQGSGRWQSLAGRWPDRLCGGVRTSKRSQGAGRNRGASLGSLLWKSQTDRRRFPAGGHGQLLDRTNRSWHGGSPRFAVRTRVMTKDPTLRVRPAPRAGFLATARRPGIL